MMIKSPPRIHKSFALPSGDRSGHLCNPKIRGNAFQATLFVASIRFFVTGEQWGHSSLTMALTATGCKVSSGSVRCSSKNPSFFRCFPTRLRTPWLVSRGASGSGRSQSRRCASLGWDNQRHARSLQHVKAFRALRMLSIVP